MMTSKERIGKRYGFQWSRIDVAAAEVGFMKFLVGLHPIARGRLTAQDVACKTKNTKRRKTL
jgi:hypothetical protein